MKTKECEAICLKSNITWLKLGGSVVVQELPGASLVVVRQFEKEILKFKKWFTKFKNINQFSKLKKFFLVKLKIFSVWLLFYVAPSTKKRFPKNILCQNKLSINYFVRYNSTLLQ
jgi:hypothetical protein